MASGSGPQDNLPFQPPTAGARLPGHPTHWPSPPKPHLLLRCHTSPPPCRPEKEATLGPTLLLLHPGYPSPARWLHPHSLRPGPVASRLCPSLTPSLLRQSPTALTHVTACVETLSGHSPTVQVPPAVPTGCAASRSPCTSPMGFVWPPWVGYVGTLPTAHASVPSSQASLWVTCPPHQMCARPHYGGVRGRWVSKTPAGTGVQGQTQLHLPMKGVLGGRERQWAALSLPVPQVPHLLDS